MCFTPGGIARKVVDMEMQDIKVNEPASLLIWIVNIAIIFFYVAGIPAIMAWIPTSMSRPGDSANLPEPDKQSTNTVKPSARKISMAPAMAASNAPTQAKCAECGVIESVSEVNIKRMASAASLAARSPNKIAVSNTTTVLSQ